MKRNILLGLISAATAASMLAMPVYANELATELTTTVESAYTLEIPANNGITYGVESTAIGEVSVTGNVLPTDAVTVTATTDAFKNQSQSGVEDVPFTLRDTSGDVFTGATWNGAEINGQTKAIELSVDITPADWQAAAAGTYAGSITFTAAINN
jgi:hypothetical protein